jgi:hypothetical protein
VVEEEEVVEKKEKDDKEKHSIITLDFLWKEMQLNTACNA